MLKHVLAVTGAIMAASLALVPAVPVFAAQYTAGDVAAQTVLADNSTGLPDPPPENPDNSYSPDPDPLSPPPPPESPDNAYSPDPDPLPPPPPPENPDNAYPPNPNPPETPDNAYPPITNPIQPVPPPPPPTQPQVPWQGYGYSGWYNQADPGYSAPVIIYQQPQTTVQTTNYVPVITTFGADAGYIQPGQKSTLSWSVDNADTVTITPSIGVVAASGSYTVSPRYTTTYMLTAKNSLGTVGASTTVTVSPLTYTTRSDISAGTVVADEYTGSDGGDSGTALVTSGPGTPDILTDSRWVVYLLFLGLLALGAGVAVYLLLRKPSAAYAGVRAGGSTVCIASMVAPVSTVTSSTVAVSTAVITGHRGSLISPDGKALPVTDGVLGRRELLGLAQPVKADLISRQHLSITYGDGRYMVEDLNSTNGTRLNGVEISCHGKQPVEDGDIIEVAGILKLVFRA